MCALLSGAGELGLRRMWPDQASDGLDLNLRPIYADYRRPEKIRTFGVDRKLSGRQYIALGGHVNVLASDLRTILGKSIN